MGESGGPNDCLNWLVFQACNVMYDGSLVPGQGLEDAGALYPFQRWAAAFNGLHSMLGYHSQMYYPCDTPAAFAKNMLGANGVAQTIVQAWMNACLATQVDTPGVPTNTVPYAMGLIDQSGAMDADDYYPGKGKNTMGPPIPPSQVNGGWWAEYMSP